MKRGASVLIAVAAMLGLSGCASTGVGTVSAGYSGGSYNPYYASSAYRTPYYGWYDGFYYPGAGAYVYDRSGVRQRWSDGHRSYWESRRSHRPGGENWSGFRPDRGIEWRERQGRQHAGDRAVGQRRGDGVRERAWNGGGNIDRRGPPSPAFGAAPPSRRPDFSRDAVRGAGQPPRFRAPPTVPTMQAPPSRPAAAIGVSPRIDRPPPAPRPAVPRPDVRER